MISRLLLILCLSSSLGRASAQASLSEPVSKGDRSPPRARVFVVEDPRSVFAFSPDREVVENMVSRGICALTGKADPAIAWRGIVSTQDTVGLKVYSSPGPTSGTRPAVVAAVVKALKATGIPGQQIIIWDRRLSDLRQAGFVELADRLGVQVAGSADEGYDDSVSPYESALLGKPVWGDFEFGKKGESLGRKSYVSKLVSQRITKIINITPLLNHNLAHVTGNLYSLALGSVDNTLRFETGPSAPSVLSQVLPEIYAMASVGDHVVLNIVDALICQYQGEERSFLHYSAMLGQIRLSTDPVALDVLSIRELDRQRQLAKVPPVKVNWQIYANAALLELGISDPHGIEVVPVDMHDDRGGSD